MKILVACIMAVAACLALASIVSAAPSANNPNIDVIPLVCEGLGSVDVITMEHPDVGFAPDGEVFVAKRIEGDSSFTVTTFDGVEFGPIFDSSEEGSRGRGFEGRLIECSFTQTFSEHFPLDAGFAEFLGIPDEYIGTEVTLEGTFDGTAWVLAPGR